MKQRLGDWVVFSAYPGHDFFNNRLFDQIGACDTNGRVLIIAAISKKEFLGQESRFERTCYFVKSGTI